MAETTRYATLAERLNDAAAYPESHCVSDLLRDAALALTIAERECRHVGEALLYLGRPGVVQTDLVERMNRAIQAVTGGACETFVVEAPFMLDALRKAEFGLLAAGAGLPVVPEGEFIPSPVLALQAVRAAIAKATTP